MAEAGVRSGHSGFCLSFSLALIENGIAIQSTEWLRAHCPPSPSPSSPHSVPLEGKWNWHCGSDPDHRLLFPAVDLCAARGSSGHTRDALSSARAESVPLFALMLNHQTNYVWKEPFRFLNLFFFVCSLMNKQENAKTCKLLGAWHKMSFIPEIAFVPNTCEKCKDPIPCLTGHTHLSL